MTKLVGLVPAAGKGTRIATLPCNKEIFPVGFMDAETDGRAGRRPKPVGLYLLERMQAAGARRIFMIVNKEKGDLLRYFGNGSHFGLQIAYLLQEELWGMPYALNLARPWLHDELVLFGMPDTIFDPADAFRKMLAAYEGAGADLVLGLFPTAAPQRFGMVAFDAEGRMLYTVDKPAQSDLKYMWGIGCWGPAFTEFMNAYLQDVSPPGREVVLGDVFQAALEAGLNVRVLPFEDAEYVDVGTPEDLVDAVARFAR
jgi:glucose-1-phosphate thymidylyltransferase